MCPFLDVEVERPDAAEDLQAPLAGPPRPSFAGGESEPGFPGVGDFRWEVEGLDAGVVLFDVGPECASQGAGELAEAAEVHAGAPLVEIADQHVADRRGLDLVVGDQFLGRELAQPDGGAQALVRVEDADLAQHVPGSVQAALVPVVAADVPGAELQHVVSGELVEFLA